MRERLLRLATIATPGLDVQLAVVQVLRLERPPAEGERASLAQPPVSPGQAVVRMAEVQPAAAQLEQR